VKRPIYLDYNATTPVDPRVLEAMLPYFTEVFGNPASKNHTYGNEAFKAVEDARETIAKAIKARSQEIVFTSGATEAINLAIKGVALANRHRGKHFITVATEHKAVLDCFDWLTANGFETTILPVDCKGLLDPVQLAGAIRPDTILVSVMAANNEIGVIQPLKEIGKICRDRGIYFMTDATQAIGKMPLDVQALQVDLLAASGHKVYGPKGIGFLYVRRSNPRVVVEPIIHGGGHEKGLRSGTLAPPSVVGLARAVEIAIKEMPKEQKRLCELRDQLLTSLLAGIPDAKVNGCMERRLAGNLNLTLPGVQSEALMIALKSQIAVSSGSACTTAAVLASHVLTAVGLTEEESHSSIRLSLGRFTSPDDISSASTHILLECKRIRGLRYGSE
jgi:cysteine desulfurase